MMVCVCEIDSCSCNGTESGASGQSYPDEIDFTTKA